MSIPKKLTFRRISIGSLHENSLMDENDEIVAMKNVIVKRYNAYTGLQDLIEQIVNKFPLILHTLNSAKTILDIQEKVDLKMQSAAIPYDGLYIKSVIKHIEDDIGTINAALAAYEKHKKPLAHKKGDTVTIKTWEQMEKEYGYKDRITLDVGAYGFCSDMEYILRTYHIIRKVLIETVEKNYYLVRFPTERGFWKSTQWPYKLTDEMFVEEQK